MPVKDTDICPYCAEWPAFNEENGKTEYIRLYPENIMAEVALGSTTMEIAEKHAAPVQAVEHVLSMIPFMMAWRDILHPHIPSTPEGGTAAEEMAQMHDMQVNLMGPEGQ